MLDYFPLPKSVFLQERIAVPLAEKFNLPTLPDHIHEVLFAALLYHFILVVVSPWLSTLLFPKSYPALSRRTKFNWDIHVVSFFQSIIVCSLALYDMFYCEERPLMTWRERVFGYTGSEALIQAFATGYFVWDLYICGRYINMFGPGMLAHAVSALNVYSCGYVSENGPWHSTSHTDLKLQRPFVNFYSPSFILYELSSPFLNIHWFCDKLDMTGSTIQFINGIALLGSFFGARIVYGSYASVSLFYDIYQALQFYKANPTTPPLDKSVFRVTAGVAAQEVVKYAPATAYIPQLLWIGYLASNGTLHLLNFYWFGQMITALRKRFDPPLGTRGLNEKKQEKEQKLKVEADGVSKSVEVVETTIELKKRPVPHRYESDLPPPT
jgi:hypothetical protein